MCDLKCSNDEWNEYYNRADTPYKRQISTNRNIVRDAVEGSILVIPRPDRGLVYCGTISGFELVNNPSWGKQYLELRISQGLAKPKSKFDEASHLRDVIQSFKIVEDEWCELAFSSIPTWIRKSFFGRSSTSRIHPIWDKEKSEVRLDPVQTMKQLMSTNSLTHKWVDSSQIRDVEDRLLCKIGPETFEHLMVALLALEEPHVIWEQVGGSGDGGVDGLGTCKKSGKVIAVLQSKWAYHGETIKIVKNHQDKRVILSSLLHPKTITAESVGMEFYGLNRIAKLVVKHANSLPWARLMCIKQRER